MKKISLIAIVVSAVLLLQSCAKDTVTATATSTEILFANINDTLWTPDTLSASITYSSATKSKVFACTGMFNNRQINIAVTQANTPNTAGFPLNTFNVDATSNVALSYYKEQKNLVGNYTLVQQGVVQPGSGTVSVTAIDSVKKLITGTFSFTTVKNNLDANGNIVSVNFQQIQAGAFNNMPYTFISN